MTNVITFRLPLVIFSFLFFSADRWKRPHATNKRTWERVKNRSAAYYCNSFSLGSLVCHLRRLFFFVFFLAFEKDSPFYLSCLFSKRIVFPIRFRRIFLLLFLFVSARLFLFYIYYYFLRCHPCGACCSQVAISIDRPFYFGILKRHARSFPSVPVLLSPFIPPLPRSSFTPLPPCCPTTTTPRLRPRDVVSKTHLAHLGSARARASPLFTEFWIFKIAMGKAPGWLFSAISSGRVVIDTVPCLPLRCGR